MHDVWRRSFPPGIGTHLQRVLRRTLDLWGHLELTDLARQRIQHGAAIRIGFPQQRHSVEVQKIEGQEYRFPTSLEEAEICTSRVVVRHHFTVENHVMTVQHLGQPGKGWIVPVLSLPARLRSDIVPE